MEGEEQELKAVEGPPLFYLPILKAMAAADRTLSMKPAKKQSTSRRRVRYTETALNFAHESGN